LQGEHLDNKDCFDSSLKIKIFKNKNKIANYEHYHHFLNSCGWKYKLIFDINRADGSFNVLNEEGGS